MLVSVATVVGMENLKRAMVFLIPDMEGEGSSNNRRYLSALPYSH